MALYVTRPRRDEVRIGRGLPSDVHLLLALVRSKIYGMFVKIIWQRYLHTSRYYSDIVPVYYQ